jgi:hypothetical protein
VIIQPNEAFEIIWIAWFVSWIAASFWSARTEKRAKTWENMDLPHYNLCRSRPDCALDSTSAGRETNLGDRVPAIFEFKNFAAAGGMFGGWFLGVPFET